jgi:NAD(P)-dependent dehydrogenase (short-subunit alcohol dehydrogenase family)
MDARRHAIVTGGGGGIGFAVACALADVGYRVTIMGRDQKRLEDACRKAPALKARPCDVGAESSVATCFRAACDELGPASVLVNSAGFAVSAPFLRQTTEDWSSLWRTNVMGTVLAIRQVLEPMKSLPAGRIINIASTAALKGYAYVSAYTATKHAVLGLTRALAVELAKTAVTVNAVCPGYTDTEIVRAGVATITQKTGRTAAEALASFTGTNPQGRLTDPSEIAAAVLWLVSNEARGVTGQAIALAGGEVM